jgi:hypothetical protein
MNAVIPMSTNPMGCRQRSTWLPNRPDWSLLTVLIDVDSPKQTSMQDTFRGFAAILSGILLWGAMFCQVNAQN